MLHMTGISEASAERITVTRSRVNLGHVVRDQVTAISADGFGEVDVRWNSDLLIIEGRNDEGYVQRAFRGTGTCIMERIERSGAGVERYYDFDGTTLISEEIFDESEDR